MLKLIRFDLRSPDEWERFYMRNGFAPLRTTADGEQVYSQRI